MSIEVGELHCTLGMETMAPTGEVLKRVIHKNTILELGRNEFKEIVLKVVLGGRSLKYLMKDIQVHKRFVKEGKATVKLPAQRLQFMISNCPPDRLIIFLKAMTTKLECLKQSGVVVTERKKLLSQMRTFQGISPLNMKELQTVHKMRAKSTESKPNLFTPKGKRKRDPESDKENQPPKGKRLLKSPLSAATLRSNPNPMRLTKEQNRVLQEVQMGRNVFFTGSAGTGKSFLLRRIIGALAPQHTFATASTGVAACHIGGTTLHAFAGIGSGKASLEQCVELASRNVVAQQWKKCKHLIIDEISMVDGDFFNKLEIIARVIRKDDSAFGGIQLILCGDFLQLPPVTKTGEKRKFAFQSKSWRKCIDVNLELTDVKRQSDNKFINVLQNIRLGRCPSHVEETLTATAAHSIDRGGILGTRLCTHKEDVDTINSLHLNKLQGASHVYAAYDSDPALEKTINVMCPVNKIIELKEKAQVMLAKNLDVQKGLVNGARGVIVGFEQGQQDYPIVKFLCGTTTTLRPERWTVKACGGIYLTRKQLPLKLAWAISIHKSQGMSLDCVEISLARVFESGQAYVALSRARSLEGLRVLDFDRNCVRANPEVLKFYKEMQLSGPLMRQAELEDLGVWRTPFSDIH